MSMASDLISVSKDMEGFAMEVSGKMMPSLTLGDVVKAVQDGSRSDREVVRRLSYLFAMRRVRYAPHAAIPSLRAA